MSQRGKLDLQIVLQAAAEIADLGGLEELTLATLAQKLGIRPPSLYNHVNGLPGLRGKLAIYAVQKLTEEVTLAVVGRSRDDAVRAMAEAYIRFARSHPGLYEASLRAPDSQEAEWQQAAGHLVELNVRVLNGYGLQDDEAVHTVRGLRSLLHGFASLERAGGFGLPLDVDVSFRLMIETFLEGIHALERRRFKSD